MSYVFEADDALLSRRVAIKIVDDPQLAADTMVHEARALAAVRHPGLPAVYGVGLHDGWTYLVMERLYGVTLEDQMDRSRGRPFPLDEGVAILAPVAEVLGAVHAAGLAHRDLKPANVMLCPGRVVLMDFGIVLPEVTARHGGRCGTPRYLAPELATDTVVPGRAHLVDTYAFGTMAFEMFAGCPPFAGETMIELLEHHVRTPAPHLGALRPDLPRGVSDLVLACMAKDPAERPADMQAVTWELRKLARRTPSSGSERSPAKPLARPREVYRRAITDPAIELTAAPWETLIVDDDEDNREGMASALQARGFRTRIASDGREALELIRRTGWRPAVIVLDLNMPDMDGFQFLAVQAADPLLQDIPVVVVSGQPNEQARSFASVRGMLSKPLLMPSLADLLGNVCSSQRLPRA